MQSTRVSQFKIKLPMTIILVFIFFTQMNFFVISELNQYVLIILDNNSILLLNVVSII